MGERGAAEQREQRSWSVEHGAPETAQSSNTMTLGVSPPPGIPAGQEPAAAAPQEPAGPPPAAQVQAAAAQGAALPDGQVVAMAPGQAAAPQTAIPVIVVGPDYREELKSLCAKASIIKVKPWNLFRHRPRTRSSGAGCSIGGGGVHPASTAHTQHRGHQQQWEDGGDGSSSPWVGAGRRGSDALPRPRRQAAPGWGRIAHRAARS